jgi:hypothetical protein
MRLPKLKYSPGDLADFFTDGIQTLGGVCERSWHDRLEVLAEGRAAAVWGQGQQLIETELHFWPAGETSGKDASRDIFPGCPLTFTLADLIRGPELTIDRVAVRFPEHSKAPPPETASRLWQAQFPGTSRWEQKTPFVSGWCFSVLAIARCEVQAIDQTWSLHRLTLSLPDGTPDEKLAANLEFAEELPLPSGVDWPILEPQRCATIISSALNTEMTAELGAIRQRQEAYLRRELERVDSYFSNYARELASRSRGKEAALKLKDRLAATQVEHQRRRSDQVQRHEIRVIPHVDALTLLAEPCWNAQIRATVNRSEHVWRASFNPRARMWVNLEEKQVE